MRHGRVEKAVHVSNGVSDVLTFKTGGTVVEFEERHAVCRAIQRAWEGGIRLDAEHDAARETSGVPGLMPANQPGDAMRKDQALRGQRFGAGAETAAAIAEVEAQVKSGPVVDGRVRRRLEWQAGGWIGRECD